MNTKTLITDHELWQRISDFSIDQPGAVFPFSRKLAREEGWTSDFTERAIEEYKKFVYLCCILPNGASPSETVDKVWHMHLMYTQNYWEEFCPGILRRKLHHHPSNGGISEKNRHQNWLQDTLEKYKEVFQQDAPGEIWHNKNKGPKPEKRNIWIKSISVFSLLSLLLLMASCSDNSDPFFPVLFILIMAFIFFITLVSWSSGINNFQDGDQYKNKGKDDGSSGGGGGSGCGSSCGGGCGGGCGGCGGCGGG
ncbi:glycine-rich domain-containing protein [Chryseobacterium shigense]|uniref:TIGR04222 domain-containing protein n=1 Tax=Chryseobacterium shigense TaxID=297244 RepID=A0A841NJ92_9FLAO|nr:hypothetical protein [Chryseobacterium shigense]MBB6371319.1 hypothetical protein [Chryseobacterium shigense]